MAIVIDGKIFRNIQEQVEKNKEDIAAWTNIEFTLNNFGITVLGRVDAEADIPEGTYEYGDAYLVGEEEPYDIYIFTRNGADGEFINMGPLTIVGPQGPTGEQGPAGTIEIGTVTTGAAGSSATVTNTGTSENAILDFTIPRGATGATGAQGEQGPQGETGATGAQGPQGPQGDPGESFMIIGTITSTSQLPDPSTTPRNYAYVLDDSDPSTPNKLYYITGTVGNEQWSYSSLAAAGTTVSVSGNPVSTWSADTKVDEPSTAGSDGDVLTLSSGVPTWATPASGGGSQVETVSVTSLNWLSKTQNAINTLQNAGKYVLRIKFNFGITSTTANKIIINKSDFTITTGTMSVNLPSALYQKRNGVYGGSSLSSSYEINCTWQQSTGNMVWYGIYEDSTNLYIVTCNKTYAEYTVYSGGASSVEITYV